MKNNYFIAVIGGVFLYGYLSLFKNALIDDAFITLRYVKTILTSGTWGVFPGYITNTATSPLNVILLTLISLIIGPTVDVPIWLALAGLMIASVALIAISRQLFATDLFGYLAAFAIIFNPLLISTIGLEGIVFTALFISAIYSYLCQKWTLLGAILGLLTVTRAEGGLFFLVLLIFMPSIKVKVQLLRAYVICIAPWYIFSWLYLGSVIPDTLFIKTAQASWGDWGFYNGLLLYGQRYPLETVLTLAFLPLGVCLCHKQVRNTPILFMILLLGIVHFSAYALLKVPPYHWYYVPEITVIILFGSFSLGVIYQQCLAGSWQHKAMQGIIALSFLTPAVGMLSVIAAERFKIKEMPIHTNWATHEQYKNIGLWLKAHHHGESIQLSGEVGTLAFYCDCFLLDVFSDRRIFREIVIQKRTDKGLLSRLYRVNFLFFTDNPKFEPFSYRLTGYESRNAVDTNSFHWDTASKWVPAGGISLSAQ